MMQSTVEAPDWSTIPAPLDDGATRHFPGCPDGTRHISWTRVGTAQALRRSTRKFVEQAKNLEPRYLTMVIPSRWFSGGKGLDDLRDSIVSDNRLRSIDDFLSAADVFPGGGWKVAFATFFGIRKIPGHAGFQLISRTGRIRQRRARFWKTGQTSSYASIKEYRSSAR
jgi:Eco57I restriction-modification methylase